MYVKLNWTELGWLYIWSITHTLQPHNLRKQNFNLKWTREILKLLWSKYMYSKLSWDELGVLYIWSISTPTNLTISGSKIWIYSQTKNVSNYCVVSTFKQTKSEDDQQWRWPKMKTTNKSTAMLVYVCFVAFFYQVFNPFKTKKHQYFTHNKTYMHRTEKV